jgi:hypothetical protein
MHRGQKITEKNIFGTSTEEVVHYDVGTLDDTRQTEKVGVS